MCKSVHACACERAVCLESAVRMHSRDQRLLGECALNLWGLAAEIVLCFPKYMLSLEQRIAVDQSVSHHPFTVTFRLECFVTPLRVVFILKF